MKKYKYIDTFPKPFLEDLVNNRCLPFIGAGFSKNADIPKGKKMLDWDELGRLLPITSRITNTQICYWLCSAYSHEYSRTSLVEKLYGIAFD